MSRYKYPLEVNVFAIQNSEAFRYTRIIEGMSTRSNQTVATETVHMSELKKINLGYNAESPADD